MQAWLVEDFDYFIRESTVRTTSRTMFFLYKQLQQTVQTT